MEHSKDFYDMSIIQNEYELRGGAISYRHFHDFTSRMHSCPSGKDVYFTYENAVKALKIRKNRERTKQIYKCHICGYFHLTTKGTKLHRAIPYSRSDEKQRAKTIVSSYTQIMTNKPNKKSRLKGKKRSRMYIHI